MTLEKLAIHGGPRTNTKSFKRYTPIGKEEVEAAKAVVESGVLSQFLGAWHEDFYGGPKVQEFERVCETYFGVKHAVTVNSWTSGLIAAVGAIGIEPGDEVIVSPWTMSASATAILHRGWGLGRHIGDGARIHSCGSGSQREGWQCGS